MYSGLAAARSALSSVVCLPGYKSIAEHPMISRFLKGVYNKHPPLPKYSRIWDINVVLKYYDSLPPNELLDLKQLTHKVAVLLMILGAKRKQTLLTINIDNITFSGNQLIILPNSVQKHNKPGRHIEAITYNQYVENQKLCIVNCMGIYLQKRKHLVPVDVKPLFITYGTPHKPASSDTLSRWVKADLKSAGVDTSVFQAHSCRSASASKAKEKGVPVQYILKRGCWKAESTFRTFYDKQIINHGTEVEEDYVNLILN